MNKSILKGADHISHLPHHGFNLSHDFAFTSSVGMLLPVMYDILNPGEKVTVDFNLETLTSYASVKPVMSDIDEHIDVFFVPFSKIFTPSLQILANVDDLNSSLLELQKSNLTNGKVIPVITEEYLSAFSDNFMQNLPPLGALVNGHYTNESNFYLKCDEWYDKQRLLEHLGYNFRTLYYYLEDNQLLTNSLMYNPDVSPAFLAAYQACYYDYYRLSNFEANDVYAYNLDRFASDSDLNVNDIIIEKLLTLRYRPYRRDYFKLIERSPLQGSLGVLTSTRYNLSDINQWLSVGSVIPESSGGTSPELNPIDYDTPTTVGGQRGTSTYNGILGAMRSFNNTASLRTAFAFEKLLRISARAGKHYDDQVAAHFGFRPNNAYSNEVIFLGSHHQKLVFKPVVSQAETEGTDLGQMAGRGIGLPKNSKSIKYTAPCHGVLLAIYSASPNVYYETGLDKLNTMLLMYDFYQPEFDKLGMQPLFHYEFLPESSVAASRRGWQYRYQHMKLKYDRITSSFQNYDKTKVASDADFIANGVNYNYLVVGNALRMSNGSIKQYLYVNPHDIDNLLVVGYNPAVAINLQDLNRDAWDEDNDEWNIRFVYEYFYRNMYSYTSTDPFINNCHIKYFKTSPMSTFGEPDI